MIELFKVNCSSKNNNNGNVMNILFLVMNILIEKLLYFASTPELTTSLSKNTGSQKLVLVTKMSIYPDNQNRPAFSKV